MCPSHYNLWHRGADDPALQEASDRWMLEKRRAFAERSAHRAAFKAVANPASAPAPAFDVDADAALCAELSEILKHLVKTRG
jgi:hypothetical protein